MHSSNPFATPQAEALPSSAELSAIDGSGQWRQGKILVQLPTAAFADACVKCGSPAHGFRLKRTLYWHTPILYALVFFAWMLYLIIALIVRKKASVDIPLCEAHQAKRRKAIIAGWITFAVAWLPLVLGVEPALSVVVLVLGILGGVIGMILSRVVHATKIDDRLIRIGGVSEAYLSRLTEFTG